MRAFIDTNILIDVLAHRESFFEASSNVVNLGVIGEIELCTTSLSYATTVYITRPVLGYTGAIKAMKSLEPYLTVVPMDAEQCHNALFSDMPDFEDMLQYNAAIAADADVIVTRNKKHFPKQGIPILTPQEFLAYKG